MPVKLLSFPMFIVNLLTNSLSMYLYHFVYCKKTQNVSEIKITIMFITIMKSHWDFSIHHSSQF